MRLVLELGVHEPACGNFWLRHCRELAAWRWVLQGVTEAADGLLATSIQPFLGLADALLNTGADFHRFRCGGLRLARRRRCLSRAAHTFLSLPLEGSAVAARPGRDSAA